MGRVRITICPLVVGVVAFAGCAGSWKKVDKALWSSHQGYVVEAVVVSDGRTVAFDSTRANQRGFAKIEGETVRGYVDGKVVEIDSSSIRRIRFAQVESKTSSYVVGGVLFALVLSVFAVMFFGFEGYRQ